MQWVIMVSCCLLTNFSDCWKVKHIFVTSYISFCVICWGPNGFLVNFHNNSHLFVIFPKYTFQGSVASGLFVVVSSVKIFMLLNLISPGRSTPLKVLFPPGMWFLFYFLQSSLWLYFYILLFSPFEIYHDMCFEERVKKTFLKAIFGKSDEQK